MKFLFVTAGVPSRIGQNHVLDLLEALACEHDSTVVTFDLGEAHLAHSNAELERVARVIRVPFRRMPKATRAVRSVFTRIPVAVQGFASNAMKDAIAAAMSESRFDVVVFEQLVMGQYAERAGDTPRLFLPVDAVSRFKRQTSRNATNLFRKIAFTLDAWLTEKYERRVYEEFDRVLFVSGVDAEYARARGQADGARISVLPLAVDAEYFHPRVGRADGSPTLAFLGNMANAISEDAVLWFRREVWDRLKETVPELKLYVVGNTPSERVRALAQRDSSIIVTGFLEDIRTAVRDATVFISPLRLGAGVKNRILQAMAMGKAIVASPASVEGIGVNPGREFVAAECADEWFGHCVHLLRNADERERLGSAARKYVERHHSAKAKASRFLQIARSVQRALPRSALASAEQEATEKIA